MPISVSPGTSGSIPGTPPADYSGAVASFAQVAQFLLQMKQQKRAIATQEQQSALQQLEVLMKLSDAGMQLDPGAVEKVTAKAFPGALAKGAPIPVTPQQGASLGGAQQGVQAGGQAGAASATPPSRSAANKAPGGGVTPPIIDPQSLQSMLGQRSQLGQMKTQQETVQAQFQTQMSQVAQQAMGDKEKGIPPDPEAGLKLAIAHGLQTGQGPDENLIRAIYQSASPEQQVRMEASIKKFNDIKDVPARQMEFSKILMESPVMAGVFSPADIPRVAQAMAKGEPIPADIHPRLSLAQQAQIEDTNTKLIASGVPPAIARSGAETSVLTGKSVSDSLVTSFKWGHSLAERQIAAEETKAEASKQSVEVARQEVGVKAGELTLKQKEDAANRVSHEMVVQGGLPSYAEGWKLEDAINFSKLSAELGKPEHAALKAEVDSIGIFARALGDKAGSNERLQLMIKDAQEHITNQLGLTFEGTSPEDRSWYWWDGVFKLAGPGAASAIRPFTDRPPKSLPEQKKASKPAFDPAEAGRLVQQLRGGGQ